MLWLAKSVGYSKERKCRNWFARHCSTFLSDNQIVTALNNPGNPFPPFPFAYTKLACGCIMWISPSFWQSILRYMGDFFPDMRRGRRRRMMVSRYSSLSLSPPLIPPSQNQSPYLTRHSGASELCLGWLERGCAGQRCIIQLHVEYQYESSCSKYVLQLIGTYFGQLDYALVS